MTSPGPTPSAAILTAPETLDIEAGSAFATHLASFDPGSVIVIDLGAMTFCDSTGIRVLLTAWRRQDEAGGAVHLVNARPHILRLFETLGIAGYLADAPPDGLMPSADGADRRS